MQSAVLGNIPEVVPTPQASNSQFLTFELGAEIFGISILMVKEIIEYRTPTTVPMMPMWISGVINLRDVVVPVLDLAVRFGQPTAPLTKRTSVIIVEVEAHGAQLLLGVLVDAVNEVQDIPVKNIAPVPNVGGGIRADFLQGLGKHDGGFVLLLDAHKLLQEDELQTLVEMKVA